jgi:hypothetical protein
MKKLCLTLGLFFLLFTLNVTAQSKTGIDYFAGKWSVLVKGTPQGDAKLIVVLDNKVDSLVGVVQDSTGVEISKMTNIGLKDSTLTFNFMAQGYDVNVLMNKKDDDHVIGSLMNMFDVEGERVKVIK